MVDAFEAVSFLTRSENRVEVLECLAGGAYTERELVAETGVTDVTMGRVLEDFTERGWVIETDDGYTTTRLGDLLAEDYARFRESMDLACRLGPVRELLPLDAMEFDLRHLTDGLVSDPDTIDSVRAVDRRTQLLRRSDRVVGTGTVHDATTLVAEPFREAVVKEGLAFEVVVSGAYYERARSRAEMREPLRDILRAGGEMYLAGEEMFPASVALFDDLATITGYDDSGDIAVGIESRADPVREWVRGTYEGYRGTATPLSVDDFAE